MKAPRAAAAAIAAPLMLCLLLPAAAAAAPQKEERRIHREVVVVGGQPGHRRVIVDHLAERGYLGVQLLQLTPELRRHFGAPHDRGVLVARVLEDRPAAAAGVLVGDVITTLDGEPVASTSQLVGRIGGRGEGEQIELELVRDHAPVSLRATLARSPRRQIEVGQFVWGADEEGPVVLDLGPEAAARLGAEMVEGERFITVDPKAINESVSRLLERLEERPMEPVALGLDTERRERLERRIAELEERLRAMERQIRRQIEGDRWREPRPEE